jgi:putative transposase
MQYQRDEHRLHRIVYNLIFCPKQPKSVLIGDIAKDCAALIRAKCSERGWELLWLAVQPDHVPLCVRVFPTNAAADVVKQVKGYKAHELRQKYVPLKRSLPSLWTRSYFASTAGNISEATIRAYIDAQRGA